MTAEETRHAKRPRQEDVLEIGSGPRRRRSATTRLDSLLAHLRRDRRLWAGLVILVLLIGGAATFALVSRDHTSKVDQATAQVLALERRELQDLLRADARDLDRILSSDFETVTPDGALLTRDRYLGFLASGDLVFRQFEPTSPLRVRTDGQEAIVTFTSKLDVSAGSKHYRHRAWHTTVYEKSEGRWQVVWSQTTALGGFPPPVRRDR